jgi:hypothetical protein
MQLLLLLLLIAAALCCAERINHHNFPIAGHTELEARIEHEVLADLRARISAHTQRADATSRGESGRRPFVTLTYAQSIDGSIAAAGTLGQLAFRLACVPRALTKNARGTCLNCLTDTQTSSQFVSAVLRAEQ